MKLRKLTARDYFLIIVNLVPVYAVWFEGWNAAQVFIVYCLETVIIGIFNVLKMACVTIFIKPADTWQNYSGSSTVSGLFFIVFAETGLAVGFFLPGDSLLVVTGLMARTMPDKLNVYLVLIAFFAGSVIGDTSASTSADNETSSTDSSLFSPATTAVGSAFGSALIAYPNSRS